MAITDVSCSKVMLYVLGMYGVCDDLSEFIREFDGALKRDGGEGGIALAIRFDIVD